VFTARYGLNHMFQIPFNLSLRGLGFNPRPVLVGFVADKVALVEVFLPVLLFSLLLSLHECSILSQDKRAKTGYLLKSNVL
jgi:hypothetical protein